MAQNVEYMGDSVYSQFDGWSLYLTTNNGYDDDPRNMIHLEPAVFARLLTYVERLPQDAAVRGVLENHAMKMAASVQSKEGTP